jgi:antirestriction protein ArdC
MNDSSQTNKAARLLAESVSQLMNSETYKAALQFRNKFHAYSFRNVWLIYTQCPTATYVAGYYAWLKLGRHVKKGESGIGILAPMTRKAKDDEGSDTKHIFGFKTATVFNVEQTEGQDLPELPTPRLLELDSQGIRHIITALESYAQTQDITVIKSTFSNTTLGSFHYRSKTIRLRDDLPPLQQLKTTVHELAHALMHKKDDTKPRHVKELEAESCAYLLCDSLGLDSSSYSFAYLATWADDPNEILPAAERACKVADEILEQINTINLSPIELPLAA